jgi:hypothetical protein
MAAHATEQRRHPRIDMMSAGATCLLDEGYRPFRVADVSLGGLAIISDHVLPGGKRLKLNIDNVFGADIEVVHSEMFMDDDTFMEAKYRIGTRFAAGPLDDDMFTLLLQVLQTSGISSD